MLNRDYFKTPGAKMMAFRRYQKEHCDTCGCCAGGRDVFSSQMCFIGWLHSEMDVEDLEKARADKNAQDKALDFRERYPLLKYGGDLTHPYVNPAEALLLDNRAANALRKNKIDTMDKLLKMNEAALCKLPGLGSKSIRLILNALTDYVRYNREHTAKRKTRN